MWDFLSAAWNALGNLLGKSWQDAIVSVINWTNKIVYGVHGYWSSIAGNVQNAWQEHTRDTLLALQGMQRFMLAQSLFDNYVKNNQIPWLANWLTWLGGKQTDDLHNAVVMLERDIRDAENSEHSYAAGILSWVLVHVLAYLLAKILDLFSWVGGIGSTMWHYFTNLADFAELLIYYLVTSLESHAWDIAEKLGEFFLALIVKNLGRFLSLLETILDAVL